LPKKEKVLGKKFEILLAHPVSIAISTGYKKKNILLFIDFEHCFQPTLFGISAFSRLSLPCVAADGMQQ
jgi:hypothetical protein